MQTIETRYLTTDRQSTLRLEADVERLAGRGRRQPPAADQDPGPRPRAARIMARMAGAVGAIVWGAHPGVSQPRSIR